MKRRAFAESLAFGALAPLLGVPAEGRTSWESAYLIRSGSVSWLGGSESSPGARASTLIEIIRLEHGAHLTPSDLVAITADIQAGLDRAELLRQAELGAHPATAPLTPRV